MHANAPLSKPVGKVFITPPMSNLLKPHSIPRLAYHNVRRHRPINAMRRIPNSVTDPMPASVGAWIDTPLGIRKLLPEELAKGLGVPSGWMLPSKEIPGRFLNNLVGNHIWEALGTSLVPVLQQRSSLRGASNKLPTPPPSGNYGGVRRDDTKLKKTQQVAICCLCRLPAGSGPDANYIGPVTSFPTGCVWRRMPLVS
jgi:hypothetical protein